MQKHTYYVKGMHCASCEVLIEKELLTFPGVKFVDASLSNSQVNIGFGHERPGIERLNEIFKDNGYIFSYNALRAMSALVFIRSAADPVAKMKTS